MKKIPMAMLVAALMAITVMERKNGNGIKEPKAGLLRV